MATRKGKSWYPPVEYNGPFQVSYIPAGGTKREFLVEQGKITEFQRHKQAKSWIRHRQEKITFAQIHDANGGVEVYKCQRP